jgi:hypothetical protein
MVDTADGRTLGIGIGLLATGWFLSIIVGAVGAAAEDDDDGDGVTTQDWEILYFPVIGPFVAIGTLDAKTSGVGALLADGILQAGGAAGIVVGIINRKYKLVRYAYGGLTLSPVAGQGLRGITAAGRF